MHATRAGLIVLPLSLLALLAVSDSAAAQLRFPAPSQLEPLNQARQDHQAAAPSAADTPRPGQPGAAAAARRADQPPAADLGAAPSRPSQFDSVRSEATSSTPSRSPLQQPEPAQTGAAPAHREPAHASPPAALVRQPPVPPARVDATVHKATCADPAKALGVARIVEIDTTGGPIFGTVSRYVTEDSFLRDKEIVLTFDDGPSPAITRSILATLDRFCTKATFFQVGRMALAYPEMVREVLARGHTVGGHTWSHPLSLNKLPGSVGKAEIDRGFAAITLAAGRPIAPFFRFPGLGDGAAMLRHLKSSGIATFSVDVISNDSFISSSDRLITATLARIEQRHHGIVLFHDIKPQTARALPGVLARLKQRGYRIVHIRPRAGTKFKPDPAAMAALQPVVARSKAFKQAQRHARAEPAAGSAAIFGGPKAMVPPTTVLSPPLRPLTRITGTRSTGDNQPPHQSRIPAPAPGSPVSGWTTSVSRQR